ncbi:dynactin 5 [Plasmodium inui San Antonio 1]|uniref:Dynactin subunit 5 n=1 Tax=Plasmodium inui San Antonio 1 TaxID=1237626 RepID=W6ZWU3_9APIC|nr:dynactin 5 [Plasmodium inui San Antonio 1]EUD65267.1 dynactin 5 [Plasmodium inui San Antonio 1]
MNEMSEGSARLMNLLSEGYLEAYNTATFQKAETFNRAEYILTASGNKVSRDSILCGMKNIHMLGKSIIKSGAMLRGDLSSLYFGKYVIVGSKTLICPCFLQGREPQKGEGAKDDDQDDPSERSNRSNGSEPCPTDEPPTSSYVTLTIGDNVYIGNECIIKAALIGSNVVIGDNCVVGERVVIKDNVVIKNNTYIPNDTIIASFAKYAGCPATYVKELPESAQTYLKDIPYRHYKNFVPAR